MTLGYRRATVLADGPLGAAGTVLRGHEFHYSTVVAGIEAGADRAFAAMADGVGGALTDGGAQRGLVSGTFFHAVAAE